MKHLDASGKNVKVLHQLFNQFHHELSYVLIGLRLQVKMSPKISAFTNCIGDSNDWRRKVFDFRQLCDLFRKRK